jgi:hypothetical protein
MIYTEQERRVARAITRSLFRVRSAYSSSSDDESITFDGTFNPLVVARAVLRAIRPSHTELDLDLDIRPKAPPAAGHLP